MRELFWDYLDINRARLKKDFWTVYVGLVLTEIGFILPTADFSGLFFLRFFLIAASLLPLAAALLSIVNIFYAWMILSSLAHNARLSIRDYLRSGFYQGEGKTKLTLGPGRRLFL